MKNRKMGRGVGFFAVVLGLASLAFSFGARAEDRAQDGYLKIGKVTVRELPDNGINMLDNINVPMPVPGGPGYANGPIPEVNDAQVVLDQIINMGKEIWAIIEANRPVSNFTSDTASALPEGINGWQNLQSWQVPKTRLFQVSWENLFGMNVVDFKYRVTYTYGGNYKGRGRFLTNVTVVPADLSVSWGYTFNASGTVPSVMNAGTTRDPVAAMQLQVKWSVDTVLDHNEGTSSFYVKADGTFQDLSNGN